MVKLELVEQVLKLIEKASTDLPQDIQDRLQEIRDEEEQGSPARFGMDVILENIKAARHEKVPMCQDTGTLVFEIYYPVGVSTLEIKKQIEKAVVQATEKSFLRPNSVNSITGKNSGNNLGTEQPYLHFMEWEKEHLEIHLLLKGGGCENVGIQYSIPHTALKAGRDLEGVRRVVIDAVFQAQGKGCGPGFIGVGIGGDRGTGYLLAKKQLFRKVKDVNPDPQLQELEAKLSQELNTLGIGAMGFGGKNTVIGVKIGAMNRIPASYFVSIAYSCWATRRASLVVDKEGNGQIS